MIRRVLLVGAAVLGIAIPALALVMTFEVDKLEGFEGIDLLPFISAITVLSGTALAVGVTILWQKPGNRIGTLLVAGALLLMSVFAAWPTSIVMGVGGDGRLDGLATLWGTVALLPAFVLLFPAVGILFPDGHLPGPGWRWPVVVGVVLIGVGVVLQTFSPWDFGQDVTSSNPLAIPGLPTDVSAVGGGLAAIGTFVLLAVAFLAVIVRYRRSAGVERAQQKWLVASLGATALVFPLSMATNGGAALDDAIDLLSVIIAAIVPVTIGIAVLRYHVFEIDRVVSRGIAYGLLTAVLVATYAAVILLLQGPLGAFLGGDTISVALSTLVVAALFQPLRGRLQRMVDRRFDRASFDADLTSAAFSERLRDEVDIGAVTADLDRTVRDALKPAGIGLWLRDGRVRG